MLHMIEVRLEWLSFLRFLQTHGLDHEDGDEDFGYGMHAWMMAAFGQTAPKPWRLLADRRRPPRVLGYSRYDATVLRQHLREFADPATFAVCRETDLASRQMPDWQHGRRLAFEVHCSPVGRKSDTGVEKDVFLIQQEAMADTPLDRASIYCQWVRERLERERAVAVTALNLMGFRLVRQLRQSHDAAGRRIKRRLVRPQALFQGELVVENPEAFEALLAQGVGRHRAFGYGMVLLRPPS